MGRLFFLFSLGGLDFLFYPFYYVFDGTDPIDTEDEMNLKFST